MDDSGMSKVNKTEGRKALQRVLGRLDQWTEASCVRFSKAKCHTLHTGHSNLVLCYRLGPKCLGIVIISELKMSSGMLRWPRRPTGRIQERL